MWKKVKGSTMIGPIHVEWTFDIDGGVTLVADYDLIGIVRDDSLGRRGETRWNVKAGTFSSVGIIKLQEENGEMSLHAKVSWRIPGEESEWEGVFGTWKAVKLV